jgi:hypothetical protein
MEVGDVLHGLGDTDVLGQVGGRGEDDVEGREVQLLNLTQPQGIEEFELRFGSDETREWQGMERHPGEFRVGLAGEIDRGVEGSRRENTGHPVGDAFRTSCDTQGIMNERDPWSFDLGNPLFLRNELIYYTIVERLLFTVAERGSFDM